MNQKVKAVGVLIAGAGVGILLLKSGGSSGGWSSSGGGSGGGKNESEDNPEVFKKTLGEAEARAEPDYQPKKMSDVETYDNFVGKKNMFDAMFDMIKTKKSVSQAMKTAQPAHHRKPRNMRLSETGSHMTSMRGIIDNLRSK